MEQKKKIMIIVNASAGKGGAAGKLGEVCKLLYLGGYLPTIYFTTGKNDAKDLVIAHGKDYDNVCSIGGDGTLSETIDGLCSLDTPPILSYIPKGSTNDYARTLELSKSPINCAEVIVKGETREVDVGLFNKESHFIYIAAFGAFTDVSYETPRELKNKLGHLAYLIKGMESFPKIKGVYAKVNYDGGSLEGEFVFGSVTNSTSVGGIVRLKDKGIILNDGLFELTLIRKPKNLVDLNDIATKVMSQNYDGKNVIMIRTKEVNFEFVEPTKWTLDGESGGVHNSVNISNLPSPIKITV